MDVSRQQSWRVGKDRHVSAKKRKLHFSKDSALSLLLGIAFVLPALIAGLILWQTLTQQIYASYEQRLTTGLETFQLILNSTYRNLQGTLSRITSDNTLRITLELEILPQLKRYLLSQYQVSELDYLTIYNSDGALVAKFGSSSGYEIKEGILCRASSGKQWEGLARSDHQLFFAQTIPINYKGRLLGYACGGVSLYSEAYLDELEAILGGLPFMWPTGDLAPAQLVERVQLADDQKLGEMFDYKGGEGHYKGMVTHVQVGAEQLTAGILINLKDLEKGFDKAFLSIAVALTLLAIIVVIGLRYQTLQRQAQAKLAEEQGRAVVTLSAIDNAVLTTNDSGRIIYMNAAAEKLIGKSFEELNGKILADYFSIKDEQTGELITKPIEESLHHGRDRGAPYSNVLVRPDGIEIPIQYSVATIGTEGHDNSGIVLVLRDVKRERHLQRTLEWKATRDDLTGLFNRLEFRNRLEQAILSAKHRNIEHGLFYLDLDQFKVVNDTCGHHVGDQLLKNVSIVLKNELRNTDTLARLGGDEFGILLEGCSPDRAVSIAQKIRDNISTSRFSYANRVFNIGVSIGVASIDAKSTNVEDMMSKVDAACYAAKELGRNRIHVAEHGDERMKYGFAEMQWASRIKDALRDNAFQLYVQPIVPVKPAIWDGNRTHGEVLVRMLDDNDQLIAPGAFIPAAERYGLMPEIDRWIIRELFKIQKHEYQEAWRSRSLYPDQSRCLYTINLSATSIIDPGFFDFIQHEMNTHGIPPQLVCFEITETTAITHLDKATQFMRKLRAMGCRFLLDDFGTGMSSFGYLKNLPVDYLKIDGLFVKDIAVDPIDRAMVKAINEIGHIMGLKTIAEFVENDAILRELRIIGVDMAQGYGISGLRPLVSKRPNLAVVS